MTKLDSARATGIDQEARPRLITVGDGVCGTVCGYECLPCLTGTIDEIECCHAIVFSFHGFEVEHVTDEFIGDIEHYIGVKFVQEPADLGWDEVKKMWTTDVPRVGCVMIGGAEPWSK
jgi:hypothetical protein